MTKTEIYNEADCRLVKDYIESKLELVVVINIHGDMIPELIRRALARDGVYVVQYYGNKELDLVGRWDNEALPHTLVTVEWNPKTDPTARHALFAATVEYLRSIPAQS